MIPDPTPPRPAPVDAELTDVLAEYTDRLAAIGFRREDIGNRIRFHQPPRGPKTGYLEVWDGQVSYWSVNLCDSSWMKAAAVLRDIQEQHRLAGRMR